VNAAAVAAVVTADGAVHCVWEHPPPELWVILMLLLLPRQHPLGMLAALGLSLNVQHYQLQQHDTTAQTQCHPNLPTTRYVKNFGHVV
jgi:hypothetical protein